jgi:hypothetical protein
MVLGKQPPPPFGVLPLSGEKIKYTIFPIAISSLSGEVARSAGGVVNEKSSLISNTSTMTFREKLQQRAKKNVAPKALKTYTPYDINLSPLLT